MSDFLSPGTRANLDAAEQANTRGDKATRDQHIRAAYDNGTDTDRMYLAANTIDIALIKRR